MSTTLSATIACAIFDRIERDRTLILQNIEETIRDQLAIEGAKSSEANRRVDEVIRLAIEGAEEQPTPSETDMNEYQRQIQKAFEDEYQRYQKPSVVGGGGKGGSLNWWMEDRRPFGDHNE